MSMSRLILSNFFEEKWTQNHPQYLSGVSRALFPTSFLEIVVYRFNRKKCSRQSWKVLWMVLCSRMARGAMGVCLRLLKQIKRQKSELRQLQCQEQRIDRIPYSYSGLSRTHILLQPLWKQLKISSMSRTSVHCFFFSTFHALKTWFELSRVKIYGNNLRRNKNY